MSETTRLIADDLAGIEADANDDGGLTIDQRLTLAAIRATLAGVESADRQRKAIVRQAAIAERAAVAMEAALATADPSPSPAAAADDAGRA